MASGADKERGSRLFGTLRGLLSGAVALLHTRAELLSLELGEERERLKGLLVPAILAGVFLFLAFELLPLLVLIVFWETHRLAALAMVIAAYLVIGLVALLVLRRRWHDRAPPFAATIEELKKDLEALGVRE